MTADEWNAAHPVGAPVRYWPVLPPHPGIEPLDTVTRSEAWTLGHGEPVVLIKGRTGGVLLSHLEVICRGGPRLNLALRGEQT